MELPPVVRYGDDQTIYISYFQSIEFALLLVKLINSLFWIVFFNCNFF